MLLRRLFLVLTCLRLIIPLQAVAQGDPGWLYGRDEVSAEEFQAKPGDSLIVDLSTSMGYLISSENKVYASFPILSGQKRSVYYLGRSYYAATPEKTWEVRQKNIQSDRVTFAASGEFFRLFDGEKRTGYGIHGHKYWQLMKNRGNPFVSYGCVLVQDEILDVIEQSFLANGGRLSVTTTS